MTHLQNREEKTREWTEELEKQIKYIGECCQGYTRMYKSDILRYSNLQQRWTSVSITAGILGGALLTLSLSLGESKAIIIVSAFLSFGTSVSQGYLYKMNYANILADLKRQASKYSALQNNIKRQLSIPRNKREKADDYHYWITQNYDTLGETSLNIHPDTIADYRKVCEKEGLPFPDENGIDSKIVIHVNTEYGDHRENGDHRDQCENNENTENTENKERFESDIPLVNIQQIYNDQHMKYELSRLAEQQ